MAKQRTKTMMRAELRVKIEAEKAKVAASKTAIAKMRAEMRTIK